MIMKSNLKVLMAIKGVTQEKVTADTGINRNLISKLSNGKVERVDTKTLMKLSRYFDNCPIQELIYFVPDIITGNEVSVK